MLDPAQSHGDLPPILFIKMNRRKPLVVLDAEQFLEDYFYEETY